MNFDLDTKEGMDNAIEWTQNIIDSLNDHGIWHVPRSDATFQFDKVNKVVRVYSLYAREPSIRRVLEAMGYTIEDPLRKM